jgi:hypothetical protein
MGYCLSILAFFGIFKSLKTAPCGIHTIFFQHPKGARSNLVLKPRLLVLCVGSWELGGIFFLFFPQLGGLKCWFRHSQTRRWIYIYSTAEYSVCFPQLGGLNAGLGILKLGGGIYSFQIFLNSKTGRWIESPAQFSSSKNFSPAAISNRVFFFPFQNVTLIPKSII